MIDFGVIGIGDRIVKVLWVGSLWTVGYIVAPTLFATLGDRELAGSIAGEMFRVEAYLSMVCGGLLLLFQGMHGGIGNYAGPRMWIVIFMVTMIAVGQWLVGPLVAEATAGTREFAILHGVSALLYFGASLLGVWLVAVSWTVRRPTTVA